MLSPHQAQELLLAGREPGHDWPVPAHRGAGWARAGAALHGLLTSPLGVSLLVPVSCWAMLTLLAAVLLRGARDGLFLAPLLALFQTVLYGIPVATVVYYVLRRRRARTRAGASRDDTYGDARFAPLAADFAEPDAAAACLVYRPEGKRAEVGYVPAARETCASRAGAGTSSAGTSSSWARRGAARLRPSSLT